MRLQTRMTRLEAKSGNVRGGLQLHFHLPGHPCPQCAGLSEAQPAGRAEVRIVAVTFTEARRAGEQEEQ